MERYGHDSLFVAVDRLIPLSQEMAECCVKNCVMTWGKPPDLSVDNECFRCPGPNAKRYTQVVSRRKVGLLSFRKPQSLMTISPPTSALAEAVFFLSTTMPTCPVASA